MINIADIQSGFRAMLRKHRQGNDPEGVLRQGATLRRWIDMATPKNEEELEDLEILASSIAQVMASVDNPLAEEILDIRRRAGIL